MYTKTFALLALAGAAQAHMHLAWPPTLKGDNNPYTVEPDPHLNYPYSCCGQTFTEVCHGHLGVLDTDEGKPVVTWAPGQTVNFTLSGQPIQNTIDNVEGGTHYGGSCQAGFSVDGGETFVVAKSWEGNCPLRDGSIDPSTQNFEFKVPADTPTGERVLFAWTWVNREQEMNMNCASVNIANGDGDQPEQPEAPEDSETPQQPSEDSPSQESPSQDENVAQYTLDSCTCECPQESWTEACTCYDCQSTATKRRDVERRALKMHKRKLNNKLRRADVVAFESRPKMLLDIDTESSSCHSPGNPVELQYPDPGPDVDEGDGEYELGLPTGDC